MHSVWKTRADALPGFGSLEGAVTADTVIIGGGITGVTTAMRLHEAGQRVVLLEAATIATNNTGGSTGNLYGTVSQGLAQLARKWNDASVRDAVRLRLDAVDQIESTVERFGLECGFARRPLHWMIASDDDEWTQRYEDEWTATEKVGLAPVRLEASALPFGTRRGFLIDGQAQFNPYEYTCLLARALHERGVQIFEASPALDIDASEGRVRTDAGEVVGRNIVIATHSPIGFNLVQAEMEPCREYGVSARLASGDPPQGIFWVRDAGRSLRKYQAGGIDYLVVVGEKHKTGEPEPGVDYPQRLRSYAEQHYDVARFVHEWSAQQFRSADGLPYIGRSAHDNVYIATGFGADGLTWGTVAAATIDDLIHARTSVATELLTPRRFTPFKSAKLWWSENAAVVKHLVGDRLTQAEVDALSEVPPGEGRIVGLRDGKYAVHRDHDRRLTVLSPVCPHLKCHVAWNGEAKTWDCPCHGSRFHCDGRVLEGPAKSALEIVTLPEE